MSNIPRPRPCATSRIEVGVAVITIDNPPVNAFSSAVSAELTHLFENAINDSAVVAIVLTGAGKTFTAGFDIRELSDIADGKRELWDFQQPLLTIENSTKPVVAALHGTVLGGGLELAMAAHYRVAASGTQFGQPEIKLGLIPGMAGTQRLPRLVGPERAAELCCFGELIYAQTAHQFSLIDAIVEGDPVQAAIGFVSQKASRRTSDLTVAPVDLGSFRKRLSVFRRFGNAPTVALEAVEASVLPFRDGCRREQELFRERLYSLESKALRYAFFGERFVSKFQGSPRSIERVAVIGGGTMGSGIATVLLDAGLSVTLKEIDKERLNCGLASIRKNVERSVAKGKLTEAAAAERLSRLTGQTSYDGFVSQDMVIEAVFENLGVKQKFFAELREVVSPTCLLATNTSSLDINAISPGILGLHFFSPANVMKLVEVIRGSQITDEAFATAMNLVRRLGKVAVPSGNGPGFIGNRVFANYLQEARLLVDRGASVEQVNQALTNWGMAMGPLAVDDLTGLDVSLDIEQEFTRRLNGFVSKSNLLRRLVESGRLGQKNGRGWSIYDENRRAQPDPEISRMAAGHQTFTDQEIVKRCIGALIAEGQKVVAEGIASDELSVDMVFLHGFGFPAWRGGPMFFAKHALNNLAALVPR